MQPNPTMKTTETTQPTPRSTPNPAWTPGNIVATVMEKLEERGANLEDFGAITCDEIAEEIPIIAAAPDMATVLREFIIQREMGLAHVEVLYEEARALLARINGHIPP